MAAVGRPRKYVARTLEAAIERYFASISRTEKVCDEAGNVLYNDLGEAIVATVYVVPPKVSGLCLYLGIDRSTWANYCDAEQHPELASVVQRAQMQMEDYLVGELLTRTKGVQGVIFNLQNNYGWREKREVEVGPATRRAACAGMSMREKMELIAEVAGMQAGEDVSDGDVDGA